MHDTCMMDLIDNTPFFNSKQFYKSRLPRHLYLYKYENVCLSVSVCVCVCVCTLFFGHLETDWDTLWHTVSFWPWAGSKTITFQKTLFFAELLPFFYISLRFLCKFEERL